MGAFFGSFDNSQVDVLQTTFDLICRELGIDAADEQGRARIAASVITIAKSGQVDPERLRQQTVSQFKALEGEHSA
jgi:hypothetical protein